MFDAAMERFAPFESRPHLAVAVSGGADSLALCLLASAWAEERNGHVTALTVDHDLRPTSAAEAALVGVWLRRRNIPHHVLRWHGEKPAIGLQAAARAARYRLLGAWCRQAGVLHLLLGHHRGDQAETLLYRLVRGSGTEGLAGIAACRYAPGIRLLRPLLHADPAALRMMLVAEGQEWAEDPTNRDPRFTRVRLRRILAGSGPGVSIGELCAAGSLMQSATDGRLAAVAQLVARACRLDPTGFVEIDRRALASAPHALAMGLLANVCTAVGGRAYPVSAERAERAYARLLRGDAEVVTTVAGCRLAMRSALLTVCRERRHLPRPCVVAPGEELLWDGRFLLRLSPACTTKEPLVVRVLEPEDEVLLAGARAAFRVPAVIRATLPVICDSRGPISAPLLGLQRANPARYQPLVVEAYWRPRKGITGPGYFLA